MDIQISNIFETRRGKRCFNVENYKFSEFRVLKSGDLLFRCTNKKCASRITVNKEYKVINTSNTHNHEAHTDQFRICLMNRPVYDVDTLRILYGYRKPRQTCLYIY
ncbi:hypothetical protein QTP88_022975 [Uroleucon formosanum]